MLRVPISNDVCQRNIIVYNGRMQYHIMAIKQFVSNWQLLYHRNRRFNVKPHIPHTKWTIIYLYIFYYLFLFILLILLIGSIYKKLTWMYSSSCSYAQFSWRWQVSWRLQTTEQTVKMSKALVCIQLSRTLILLLAVCFIILSALQMLHVVLIPWPTYPMIVAVILDIVLMIGLIASLIQHLKTLIMFSWLMALTFLLIFFGNTVSTQYQSDLLGMFYLLLICILAFTDAVCIIKYRMPCEEAHHPFIKCSQQQLFEQAETLPVPLPPSHFLHPASSATHQHSYHHHPMTSASILASPSSPLPPPPPLNSHCYVAKNDPQFHAVWFFGPIRSKWITNTHTNTQKKRSNLIMMICDPVQMLET